MSKSFWSVEFLSQNNSLGFGIVTIDGLNVYGGDSAYYYLGQITTIDNSLSAKITVKKHAQGQSIFGPMNEFTLILSGTGTIDSSKINFSGHIENMPNQKISAKMNKITNLS